MRASWRACERGHTVEQIRRASQTGRLAYGYMDTLFPPDTGDGAAHDWTVVITVTGGLLPPA